MKYIINCSFVVAGALNFFVSSLSTLCNKTIEDTLITIRHYENARLEFDAYRCDLEELSAGAGAAAQATKVRRADLLI